MENNYTSSAKDSNSIIDEQNNINLSSNSKDDIFCKWEDEVVFPKLKYVCCGNYSTPQHWVINHPFYSRHLITNFSTNSKILPCSNDSDELNDYIPNTNEIEGLRAYPNLITKNQAHELIHIIADLNYLKTIENNQVMVFKHIPTILQNFLEFIWKDKLPAKEIWNRVPLFDQLFINWYLPGEGICKHIDLPVFEDGILSLSLGDPCLIYFDSIENYTEQHSTELILRHCDGLMISGIARYNYTHKIDYCEDELSQDGIIIERGHRVSLTMRRMVDS